MKLYHNSLFVHLFVTLAFITLNQITHKSCFQYLAGNYEVRSMGRTFYMMWR